MGCTDRTEQIRNIVEVQWKYKRAFKLYKLTPFSFQNSFFLILNFFQIYRRIGDIQNCEIFEVYTMVISYTCPWWEDAPLEVTHLSPHIDLLRCCFRTFKFCSNKFQLYHKVVSAIVLMFYIRFSALSHPWTESFSPLTYFSRPPVPGSHFPAPFL